MPFNGIPSKYTIKTSFMSQSVYETDYPSVKMKFKLSFKKLNIYLPNESAILLLYTYPKEAYVHTALFVIAPKWKQPKCP